MQGTESKRTKRKTKKKEGKKKGSGVEKVNGAI
jgi:hypothetical protein